jgi:hypothetical protein
LAEVAADEPHRKHMFPVEVLLAERDGLVETIEAMRTWLDHKKVEPAVFRYSFAHNRILFQVDFAIEAEAAEFARAFGGNPVELGRRMAV